VRVFFQIDEPATLNPRSDSSLALAQEAQARGYQLAYFTPPDLASEGGEIFANARRFQLTETRQIHADAPQRVSLEDAADVILIRQDPPFDLTYLTTTWLLGMLAKPRVFNHPKALRERPEKLFPLHFPQFCPPTLISANVADLLAFQRQYGAVVLKPLYGHGGHGVFHIPAEGTNLAALLEMFFQKTSAHNTPEPVILQQFLPEVNQEEKRILLIDGEIAGMFGRIPAASEIRSNMRVGGQIVTTTLTPTQEAICAAIAPFCQREGILLVGLDVIGDYLTEINITSPTGLRAVEQLYGTNLAAMFWEKI
jgi:glutathione synthase